MELTTGEETELILFIEFASYKSEVICFINGKFDNVNICLQLLSPL